MVYSSYDAPAPVAGSRNVAIVLSMPYSGFWRKSIVSTRADSFPSITSVNQRSRKSPQDTTLSGAKASTFVTSYTYTGTSQLTSSLVTVIAETPSFVRSSLESEIIAAVTSNVSPKVPFSYSMVAFRRDAANAASNALSVYSTRYCLPSFTAAPLISKVNPLIADSALTVISICALTFRKCAVIVTVPSLTPCTTPVSSTVAIAGSEEVNAGIGSTAPSLIFHFKGT